MYWESQIFFFNQKSSYSKGIWQPASQLKNISNNCKPSSQIQHISFYEEYFRILNTSLQTSNNPTRFRFSPSSLFFFLETSVNVPWGKAHTKTTECLLVLNLLWIKLLDTCNALPSRRSRSSELFIHQSLCNFPNTNGDQDDFSYLMLHLLKWLKRL